jgi:hypothetical protein
LYFYFIGIEKEKVKAKVQAKSQAKEKLSQ